MKSSLNWKYILPILALIVGVGIYTLYARDRVFLYTGTIEATKVDISSRISSVIASFPAQAGHKVEKDGALVLLACCFPATFQR